VITATSTLKSAGGFFPVRPLLTMFSISAMKVLRACGCRQQVSRKRLRSDLSDHVPSTLYLLTIRSNKDSRALAGTVLCFVSDILNSSFSNAQPKFSEVLFLFFYATSLCGDSNSLEELDSSESEDDLCLFEPQSFSVCGRLLSPERDLDLDLSLL
jgi:hypothetical protein